MTGWEMKVWYTWRHDVVLMSYLSAKMNNGALYGIFRGLYLFLFIYRKRLIDR